MNFRELKGNDSKLCWFSVRLCFDVHLYLYIIIYIHIQIHNYLYTYIHTYTDVRTYVRNYQYNIYIYIYIKIPVSVDVAKSTRSHSKCSSLPGLCTQITQDLISRKVHSSRRWTSIVGHSMIYLQVISYIYIWLIDWLIDWWWVSIAFIFVDTWHSICFCTHQFIYHIIEKSCKKIPYTHIYKHIMTYMHICITCIDVYLFHHPSSGNAKVQLVWEPRDDSCGPKVLADGFWVIETIADVLIWVVYIYI